MDSTAPLVCDNHRIHNHKVVAGLAQRGKGSMGRLYGFNLQLVINDYDELLACQITRRMSMIARQFPRSANFCLAH
jgi:hypothetical protein